MNKSIVLVMCDILVLSAMSLSSGGFSEADEFDVNKMKNIDFDVVSRDAFENLQQQLDEAQKNEADAKAAEKAAREAEALARNLAEEAAALETRAKKEAETARANEAHAKAEIETARENEALANVKAVEAQKREEDAKVAEKAAREAEALAKAQAEESAAREARAKKEAEAARDNEAHARADAALARQNEAEAKGRAEKATSQRNLAEAKADKLQAELDEIHARQNALVGNIPQKTIWKMAVFKRKAKKSESKTIYSPLFSLDGEGFLFVELPSIDAEVYSEVESVTAHYDKITVTGGLYRLQGHDNWIFVKVGKYANNPHIGFGVKSLGVEGNIVFYPKQGKFEGDPVKCECDGKGQFLCSNKTENRNWIQQINREHSVFEGCFLVSTIHGAIGAIARGKSAGRGLLYCEKLAPISMNNLLPIGSGNPSTPIKDQKE